MKLFGRKKSESVNVPTEQAVIKDLFLMDTLRLIKNCELTAEFDSLLAGQQVDHCRVQGELAYICGKHFPSAVKAGIVEEVIR